MRLVSITLSGYRQFRETISLSFPSGLIGICGPNGVGKSKLIEAIGYALYGPRRGLLPSGDKAADISSKPDAGVSLKVTLVIEINDQRFEIVRTPQSRKCSLRIVGQTSPLAETTKGVTDKVIELLRLPPDAFLGTFVARQREVAILQASTPPVRQKLVNRLIGISLVEKALELSQITREERTKTYDKERLGAGDGLTNVQSRLKEHRSSLEESESEATSARGLWEKARLASNESKAASESFQRNIEQCLAKEKELSMLEGHLQTINATITDTEGRIQSAEAGEAEVIRAKAVLEETKGADADTEAHETLAALNDVRTQIAAHRTRLSSVVLPKLAERDALKTTIAQLGAEQEEIRDLLATEEQQLSATLQEFRAASEDEAKHAKRKKNVEQIGAVGVCDTCGQPLGPNLDRALQHLEGERVKADARKEEAQKRIEEINEKKAALILRQTAAKKKQASNNTGLIDFQPFEREQIHIEGNLETLRSQINAHPPAIQEASYNAEAHRLAIQRRDRHQQAERDLAKYDHIASVADSARQQLTAYILQRTEKESQRASLCEEVLRLRPDPAAIEKSEQDAKAAEVAAEEARTLLHTAENKVAAIKALIAETETDLMHAKTQWAKVEIYQREAAIAARTEELMRKLLAEVTAEACPRIIELMEGWARSLMGPHFNSIQLSPDYRLSADNGSGLHQIEHFSGGEQTLLAVMLRVAISIYCQERVGYPPGFLILDEIFGDQDESHRTQLVQFLNEIKPNYHQILIVNHVTEVTGMLDSIITVTPTGERTSKAVLTH